MRGISALDVTATISARRKSTCSYQPIRLGRLRFGCDAHKSPLFFFFPRFKHFVEPAQSFGVAVLVKDRPSARQSSKKTIEEEETDSEVLIHESFVVECPVVDIMCKARRDEPTLQTAVLAHPETGYVHTVVQIAEHEETPRKRSSNKHKLMEDRYLQVPKEHHRCREKDRARDQPLQSDITD